MSERNAMNSSTYLLGCIIGEGMFSSEKSVEIKDINGKRYSLFVQQDKVKNGDGKRGQLFVSLIKKEENVGVVYLPSETLELGFRTLQVPFNELVPVSARR